MPLTRYVIRNEYSLADPEVYRCVEKDDPEALLEGIAMAGLIGVLRQLGDLAEFAAELFHDLHEEVMATSARGHGLMIRVQQLEAELPSIEKAFLSRTNHLDFAYGTGADWHSSERIEESLVTRGDLPRFVMDSYEECRAPPRLFLLDKFDIAGAGACLKRYSDPSFFKMELASSGALKADEVQIGKRARRVKRKAFRQRNGDTLEALLDSSTDDAFLAPDVKSAKTEKIPFHIVKLKMRQMNGYACSNKKLGGTYMEQILEATVDDNDNNLAVNHFSSLVNALDDVSSALEFHGKNKEDSLNFLQQNGNVQVPFSKRLKDMLALPSNESACDLGGSAPEKSVETIDHSQKQAITVKDGIQEDIVVDSERKTVMTAREERSDDFVGDLETYLDALATIESEIETDSECQIKHENELFTLNHLDVDSDKNGDQLCQLSKSCNSHVENSPASYDSNCSFVEGEREISYADSLHGLTDRKPPHVAKVLSVDESLETMTISADSQNSLELKDLMLDNLCDEPHPASAENSPTSLTDDALVRSSASDGSSTIEDMNDITLTEDSEKCVEAPISSMAVDAFESAASCHTSEDAACGSAEHALASKLSSLNEKFSPDEGQILVAVMTPERNEQHKSVETLNSDVTGDVHVEGARSCKMSGEEASASLTVHAVSTFAESNEECKPAKSIVCDVQFQVASSCQMSGEVSSSHDKVTSDEVYMPDSAMLPGSNRQDKFVESQVSDILDSMPSEGGCGLILEQPCCASSMLNGTLLLPCSHDGFGLEEVQTSFPQESGRISNPDASPALEPSTAFASNEPADNSDDQLALPDAPCQSTVADLNVEASMQCPGEAISCNSFISESGDPFPLVGKKEPEQCESGILAKEDVSVDLSKLQHGEMDKSRENIAPRGNLELVRTITAIEDEKCMIIGESAETTSASIIKQSEQRCAAEATSILSRHDIVINESAKADITSHDVHDVLSDNFETLNTPSVKMISTTQVMDEHHSYSVFKVPDSEEFTSKSVKTEREEFSGKLHNETENLEIPTIMDAIFEDSQPEPLTNVIEEFSHCVDIEPVHVVTETVEANCETKDKHVQDEICLASRYVTLNGSLPREMPSDSMLPNVAGTVEASSRLGISSTSFVEGDNASTVDDSLEILSNNKNLEGCPASEAIAGQHSHVLAELSIISESGLSNGSASDEFTRGTIRPSVVAPLGYPATMDLDSSLQIHGDGLDKGHSDYAKISCGDVTCNEEIAPYQLEVDPCTSPACALDKSSAESSELDSAGILVSSGRDNLELPCPLNLGPEQHYLPSVSAQVESEGNMPVAPLLENCRDANVQSSSAASMEEVVLGSDQCKLHDEQISTIPEAPGNLADDSHEDCFAYVQPCLQQKAAMKEMGVDQPKLQVEQMSVTSDTSDNFRGELQEECSAYMEPSYQQDAPRKETDLDQSKLHAEQISVVSDTSCSFRGVSQEECLACEEPCNQQKVEVEEVNADQHKYHIKGVTMVSDVLKFGLETEEAHSASVERQKVDIQGQFIRDDHHPSDYVEVYSRNLVNLEQGGISEALELSSATLSQDRKRFIDSEETVSFNYQVPENKRNETVPQPVLSLAQQYQLRADEVVITTSAHMDDQSSTLELGKAENLEESGHHVSHDFLKDDAGLPNNVSVEGILSTAPDQGLPELGKPLLPVKDEHSSVPSVLFPSGALVRSSSALVLGSAQVISQTDQVENHKRELVHNGHQTNAGLNISTSLVFPPLGIGTETDGMPPLPLPPVEWIMGRPRQSFSPLPGEASQQPIFIPSYPTAEAGNGGLPWKHRSLYRRPKDPLIEAVASHDKSTLRKVTERDRTEVKPKADEREVLLEQIRDKSFNLKPIAATKPAIQGPKTNIKVAAILEKANAIRQACAGTGSDDDDDEADKWSDT